MDESLAPTAEPPHVAPPLHRRRLTLKERLLLVWVATWVVVGIVALAPVTPVGSLIPPDVAISHMSFEITVHRMTPDSMTYIETDDAGNVLFSITVTKPDLVNRWFAYVNDETPLSWLSGEGGGGATPNETPVYRTYIFSARGGVIETVKAIMGLPPARTSTASAWAPRRIRTNTFSPIPMTRRHRRLRAIRRLGG